MGLLESFRSFLRKHFTCTERLNTCINDVVLLREDRASSKSQNETQTKIIDDLRKQLQVSDKNLEECRSNLPAPDPLEIAKQFWDTKYPKKRLSYHGRYMPNLKEGKFVRKRLNIDVRLYVQPNDWVIQLDILNNRLKVKDPARCNNDILKLYRHTRSKPLNPYRYEFDEPNVGVSEFWYFPHELRAAKKGDCDDWGNELASYLIAAGVPEFRVRCVAGTTYGGIGHLTVYVLADNLQTWYHLNSTTPLRGIPSTFEKLPQNGDESDRIGIKDVWFSYNSYGSWSIFKTDAAQRTYRKRPGFLKDIVIH